MRILFVERLPSQRFAKAFGSQTSFEQSHAVDEALCRLKHNDFDIIIIDLTGMSEHGLTLVRQLRLARPKVPVVALTEPEPADRARAFAAGATDVMALPIDAAELRARVEAVVRHHSGHPWPVLQIGQLSLSAVNREVTFAGRPVPVTNNEYAILELLVLRRGGVVTREMFFRCLYGGLDELQIKIIDVFICKLRRKLAAVGAVGVIGMIWGRGYVIRAIGNEIPMPERDRLSA